MMPVLKNSIDVGEFEVPRTLKDMMSALVQSLDEKLGELVDETPDLSRQQLRERFCQLTDLYLWDLLRQINDLDEARHLLEESFEFWLELSCEKVLSGALKERTRKAIDAWPASNHIQ